MTVKELTEQLLTLPQDAIVYADILGFDDGDTQVYGVKNCSNLACYIGIDIWKSVNRFLERYAQDMESYSE